MSNSNSGTKYDDVLSSILVNEKSILGFLSTIFNFLARRTDFYYVNENPQVSMGFPPGVAEELVIKVLRTCDPNFWKGSNGAKKPVDVNNEIMCSTVAQEVEVISENDDVEDPAAAGDDQNLTASIDALNIESTESKPDSQSNETKNIPEKSIEQGDKGASNPDDYTPPVIPTQTNSETYNGAERENYCWSQNIMELDVTMKLPSDIKSAKNLKVTINAGDICVARKTGEIIIKDTLPYKIKTSDSFWSVSEGKLLIHLDKVQERWWDRFLSGEEPIDLSKIDCSRPLNELPEDHIDKVRELQWNQERKRQGLPTSDEMRNIKLLKQAWNAPGSPFQGQQFDPSVLSKSTLPEQ